MRKLIFAKKINGTYETGLIDIAKNPPELFCLCEEDKANEILNLNKALVSGQLLSFFLWFRANGELHIDKSIEAMIEIYLKESNLR